MRNPLLKPTSKGLWCKSGNFHVDPARPVDHAVITHGHADHARPGSKQYYAHRDSLPTLKKRLGDIQIVGFEYGESFDLGGTTVRLEPAGHVLGSAQAVVESQHERWVVTGDFKRTSDKTCAAFQPVPCDVLITEATFGYPCYQWQPTEAVVADIVAWWRKNQEQSKTSVLHCYAFGKAQRIMAELLASKPGPIALHGAMVELTEIYRTQGIALPETLAVSELPKTYDFSQCLVLAPPSAARTAWMRRLGDYSTAFASGWMQIRGNRRRRGYDRGFVLSDHADWPALLNTVTDSEAKQVLVTHGKEDPLVRFLNEQGFNAQPLSSIG